MALGALEATVVADRESDIYEEWERLPEAGFDLLTRACRDRALAGGGHLYAWSDALPVAERLVEVLSEHPASDAVDVAGSARRLAETCKDIDLIDIAAPNDTHQEIAAALGVTVGTSKAQLSRARGKLRVALAMFAEEWET